MPPTSLFVLAGIVLVMTIALGVSLTQREGSVGAPVKRRRTALQLGRIALAPATRCLLVELERIAARHPSLGETAAKESLRTAIYLGFVLGEDLPAEFGLAPSADREVTAALRAFLEMVAGAVGEEGLATPEERFEAFRDPELRTPAGSGTWTWFPFED